MTVALEQAVPRRPRFVLSRRAIVRLMLAPAIIWILALTIFPLGYSLWIGFTNQQLGMPAQWVGWQNFSQALGDQRFIASLKFTAFYVVAVVTIEILVGFFLALLLDAVTRARGAVRTIWMLPLFATPVAVSYLSLTLFNETSGPLNALLQTLGLPGVSWLSNHAVAPWTLVLLDVWQWTPLVVLILFAALQGIPGEQAEAARVDGAGTAGLIWHIVLPRLRPAIVTVLFLRFADAVKVFDYAFALTGGGPGTSTETASLYTFRRAIGEFNLGYGSALAYIMFVVAVVVGTALLTLLQRTNKAAV